MPLKPSTIAASTNTPPAISRILLISKQFRLDRIAQIAGDQQRHADASQELPDFYPIPLHSINPLPSRTLVYDLRSITDE